MASRRGGGGKWYISNVDFGKVAQVYFKGIRVNIRDGPNMQALAAR